MYRRDKFTIIPRATHKTLFFIHSVWGGENDAGETNLMLGVNLFSRNTMTQEQMDKLDSSLSDARDFQLKDDDGNVMACGRIITAPDDIGSEKDFWPLDWYGEGEFGCTTIEYRNEQGEFVAL